MQSLSSSCWAQTVSAASQMYGQLLSVAVVWFYSSNLINLFVGFLFIFRFRCGSCVCFAIFLTLSHFDMNRPLSAWIPVHLCALHFGRYCLVWQLIGWQILALDKRPFNAFFLCPICMLREGCCFSDDFFFLISNEFITFDHKFIVRTEASPRSIWI